MAELTIDDFDCAKHVMFFKKCAKSLPEQYKTMDTNRLTLLYFSISGLDLLGKLDEISAEATIEYIYSFQSPFDGHGGFYGYPKDRAHVEPVEPVEVLFQVDFESPELDKVNNQPHIANTYVALVMLLILGDDLSRVRREAVAESLRKWQLEDGSFCCVNCLSSLDSESDIRFVYCAASICYILDLWHAIDLERMLQFIHCSQSYDGAFGMAPSTESHGGCSYCAVAALAMMGRLDQCPRREELLRWCASRQVSGFQGRIEKDPDSCYSFWVGGSLQLLGASDILERQSCARFLLSCESKMGGFQKFPEAPFPDILHSYFSICGLSLCGLLPPLDAMLGMSLAARRRAEARGLLPGTATSTTATTATTVSGAAEGTSWRRWLLLALLVLAISAWLGAQ